MEEPCEDAKVQELRAWICSEPKTSHVMEKERKYYPVEFSAVGWPPIIQTVQSSGRWPLVSMFKEVAVQVQKGHLGTKPSVLFH